MKMEKVDEPARDSAAEDEEGRREVAALYVFTVSLNANFCK